MSVCASNGVLSFTGLPVVTPFIYIYFRLVSIAQSLLHYPSICVRAKHVSWFFLPLSFGYFLVQDPRGPASFSTHARNNTTTCKNKFPCIYLSGVPISIYYYMVEKLKQCSLHHQSNTVVIENNEYEVKEANMFNILIIGYYHGRLKLIWPISS